MGWTTCACIWILSLSHHTQFIFSNNFENTFCSSESTFVGGCGTECLFLWSFGDQNSECDMKRRKISGPVGDGGSGRLPRNTCLPAFCLCSCPAFSGMLQTTSARGLSKCSGTPWPPALLPSSIYMTYKSAQHSVSLCRAAFFSLVIS